MRVFPRNKPPSDPRLHINSFYDKVPASIRKMRKETLLGIHKKYFSFSSLSKSESEKARNTLFALCTVLLDNYKIESEQEVRFWIVNYLVKNNLYVNGGIDGHIIYFFPDIEPTGNLAFDHCKRELVKEIVILGLNGTWFTQKYLIEQLPFIVNRIGEYLLDGEDNYLLFITISIVAYLLNHGEVSP